jgi:hypothetical protein
LRYPEQQWPERDVSDRAGGRLSAGYWGDWWLQEENGGFGFEWVNIELIIFLNRKVMVTAFFCELFLDLEGQPWRAMPSW